MTGYEWVLATANPGKIVEITALLEDTGLRARPQSAFGILSPAEPALTFVENALTKARHASRHAGLPAIADDSGLYVDALDGAPGLHSARFAGAQASDDENNALLLAKMAHLAPEARAAQFVCVIVALRHPEDPAPLLASGRWHGRIATSRHGENGFGYDPVFLVGHGSTTAAQLSLAEKAQLSHRGRALAQLKKQLLADNAPALEAE